MCRSKADSDTNKFGYNNSIRFRDEEESDKPIHMEGRNEDGIRCLTLVFINDGCLLNPFSSFIMEFQNSQSSSLSVWFNDAKFEEVAIKDPPSVKIVFGFNASRWFCCFKSSRTGML